MTSIFFAQLVHTSWIIKKKYGWTTKKVVKRSICPCPDTRDVMQSLLAYGAWGGVSTELGGGPMKSAWGMGRIAASPVGVPGSRVLCCPDWWGWWQPASSRCLTVNASYMLATVAERLETLPWPWLVPQPNPIELATGHWCLLSNLTVFEAFL
jgi:hypothetical protein